MFLATNMTGFNPTDQETRVLCTRSSFTTAKQSLRETTTKFDIPSFTRKKKMSKGQRLLATSIEAGAIST